MTGLKCAGNIVLYIYLVPPCSKSVETGAFGPFPTSLGYECLTEDIEESALLYPFAGPALSKQLLIYKCKKRDQILQNKF